MSVAPATRFGPYEILALIGVGGTVKFCQAQHSTPSTAVSSFRRRVS